MWRVIPLDFPLPAAMDHNSYQHWVASQTSSSLTSWSFFIHFIFLAQVPSHYDPNSPCSSQHSTAHVSLQWSNGLFKHPCFTNSYFTYSDVAFAGVLSLAPLRLWPLLLCTHPYSCPLSQDTAMSCCKLTAILFCVPGSVSVSGPACSILIVSIRMRTWLASVIPLSHVYEMTQSMKRFYKHHTWSNQTMWR